MPAFPVHVTGFGFGTPVESASTPKTRDAKGAKYNRG